jgi:hypothetical protein
VRWRGVSHSRSSPRMTSALSPRSTATSADALARATLGIAQLRARLGDKVNVVAAIVSYDEPTETIGDFAPNTL